MERAARDKAGAKTGAGASEDRGPDKHRQLIMQLVKRAERWNAGHADLVAEFVKLGGGETSAMAVMKWQRSHGLKVDGCVGPMTVAAAQKQAGPAAQPGAAPGGEPAAAGAKPPGAEGAAAAAPPAGDKPPAEAAPPGGEQAAASPGAAASGAEAPGGGDKPKHPMVAAAGKAAGMGAGLLVTEGLSLLPSWNKPVLGADGKPVESVPGAERVGDHDIKKRHEEVVGPEITALADKIPPGILHDFVAAFGAGASEAPGESYRLESEASDALHGDK